MIAEGGTERGHAAKVARGPPPQGHVRGLPGQPGAQREVQLGSSVQNTAHADLVATADGGDALVLLGMRPQGVNQSFSPLGRETFITPVTWEDGWLQPEPARLAARDDVVAEAFGFAGPAELADPGLAGRPHHPGDLRRLVADGRLSDHRPGWA